jgi:nitroreductase
MFVLCSTKKKLREAAVDQEYVETAPLLIVVCSNTSRSVGRYGSRGREFYSIIDVAFASMLILLSAVNEGIGACFVGAFQDNEVSEILELPNFDKSNACRKSSSVIHYYHFIFML